jgi:hypothetical protein
VIAIEMENILEFDCKYAEGIEKRTHRRLLLKTPFSGLHLQTKKERMRSIHPCNVTKCGKCQGGQNAFRMHCRVCPKIAPYSLIRCTTLGPGPIELQLK